MAQKQQGHIIYVDSGGTFTDAFIVNPDGSGLRNLTEAMDAEAVEPRWLPERGQIYFRSHQDGDTKYFLINPDGSGLEETTGDLWFSKFERWTQCDPPW